MTATDMCSLVSSVVEAVNGVGKGEGPDSAPSADSHDAGSDGGMSSMFLWIKCDDDSLTVVSALQVMKPAHLSCLID